MIDVGSRYGYTSEPGDPTVFLCFGILVSGFFLPRSSMTLFLPVYPSINTEVV
jgi:hypothetical protein